MANGDGKRCERDPTYVVSSPPLSPMQLTSLADDERRMQKMGVPGAGMFTVALSSLIRLDSASPEDHRMRYSLLSFDFPFHGTRFATY